jgi:hypothetical protein
MCEDLFRIRKAFPWSLGWIRFIVGPGSYEAFMRHTCCLCSCQVILSIGDGGFEELRKRLTGPLWGL